jgi:hypothetical protein
MLAEGAFQLGDGTLTHMDTHTWRDGQRAFNQLYVQNPALAASIRGTEHDPFYDDSRLDAFHRRVAQMQAEQLRPEPPAQHHDTRNTPAGTSDPRSDPRHEQLLENLKKYRPVLVDLLAEVDDTDSDGEDLLYRFWHQSLKVHGLQQLTLAITEALAALAPAGTQLNDWYRQIVTEGTGHTFTLAANDDWLQATRPIVEAYLHALSLLRLAVRYGHQLDQVPHLLPAGCGHPAAPVRHPLTPVSERHSGWSAPPPFHAGETTSPARLLGQDRCDQSSGHRTNQRHPDVSPLT